MEDLRHPLDLAERFLLHSGRLLERLRFEHLFRAHDAESESAVLAALLPYQNADGGLGQILEPDFRGPVSQPLCVDQAFRVLDELSGVSVWSTPLATRALSYLTAISKSDGGVPNVLTSAGTYPRAPWWQPDPAQSSSLLPTASLAGLLHKHSVRHPWLAPASAFAWSALASLPGRIAEAKERLPLLQALYEARAAVLFLDHTPERARAEKTAAELGLALHDRQIFAQAESEAADPLDFATQPRSLARRWFDDKTLDTRLDRLLQAQSADGGFPITWQVWTPLAGLEWRGLQTLERLKTLRAYGRL